MGHAVNDRYFGYDVQHHNNSFYPGVPFRNNAVFTPLVNFDGSNEWAVILRQLGSNRFLVARRDDKTVQVEMTLTNDDLSKNGNGRLAWYTHDNARSGWVAHIYDNTLKTFDGADIPWNINYNATNTPGVAYIANNSRD
jgi:hypothetical protein